MSVAPGTVPPPISWAQRLDLIYISIDVECKDVSHEITETSFNFKGVNAKDNTKYDVTLNFLKPVDPDRVTSKNIGRCIEFTIYKKESGRPYWVSLTGDKSKLHFLKANFLKWKSESEDEDDNLHPNKHMTIPEQEPFDFLEARREYDSGDYDSDDNIPSLSQNDDSDDEEDEGAAK